MDSEPIPPRLLSRRAFLGTGLAATGSLALAGALGSPAGAVDTKKFFPQVLSSDLYASPTAQRLVLALAHSGSQGIRYASGPSVSVRFQSPAGATTALTKTSYDRVGLPKGRGVYVVSPVLDTPGIWKVEARAQGQKIPFSIQVNAAPVTAVAGQPAAHLAAQRAGV